MLPVVWMLLAAASAKFLSTGEGRSMGEALEGNEFQRNVFTILLLMGLIVLMQRRQQVGALLRSNAPILLFLTYCAISTLWSDFPDVGFKRWIKASGDFVMILIVLTDADRQAAVKRFLAWSSFVLVPISVLLIKFYPSMGRAYRLLSGKEYLVGVTNDKAMLGVICLLFGLSSLWRVLHALREDPVRRETVLAHAAILAMALWIFVEANSMTSFASFALASSLLVVTSFPALARKRKMVSVLMLAVLAVASVALFFEAGAGMVQSLGRDATLTGRSELWDELLAMNDSPWFGTGFETFWLGPRLEQIWKVHWWHPNEAHNGYIEVFLNLGWVGIGMLTLVVVTGYRNIFGALKQDPESAGIKLAYFAVGLIFSCTEAGFRLLNPVWICFMMATMAVRESPVPQAATADVAIESPRARILLKPRSAPLVHSRPVARTGAVSSRSGRG